MRFTQIRSMAKRTSMSQKVREFFRGFLTTEELLPLTLEDICRVCPMTSGRGNNNSPEIQQKIDQCRRRYFAALLESFLGKPGDQEIDWLYSYLKKCEGCYFCGFTGAAEISVEGDRAVAVRDTLRRDSQAGGEAARDN